MKQTLDLNDGWQVTWADYHGNAAAPADMLRSRLIDAAVPGDVHLDLMRAGLLGDLYVGTNLDHALWMENKDWWYTRRLDTPADLAGRRAVLVFHGLDTFAEIWLNDQRVGGADNMFVRHEFDVTDHVSPDGENELCVRLAAPTCSMPVDTGHGCASWSPERLFHRSLWRPVELVLVDTTRITNVWAQTIALDGADATVRVHVEVDWSDDAGGTARVAGTLHQTSWEAVAAMQPGRNTITADVRIDSAPLWWPIGYGQPELCDMDVSLEADGRRLDDYSGRTGLRTLELVTEPQPSGATSFKFRCNGQDTFVTGLNWTPLDAVFARVTPEQITRTLEALAGIGCNMLRIWGGGVYERPHFYEECSRLGIMVWQDFMMSCGWYPQTDAFAAQLEAEARQVVGDLRSHACLAIWCGDNEVDMFYPESAPHNRPTREVLPRVCAELDPGRAYIPSSPQSTSGATPHCRTEGDLHHWNHGSDYADATNMDIRCRFLSEFGHLSLPSMELIERYWPAGTQWPLTSDVWRYHGANTIHRLPPFRGPEHILMSLEACGRRLPENIAQAVEVSQALQADAVCAWIESYCEDPEFGGFLLWNVGDCWPQQSDSVIDYAGAPKAVFARLGELFGRVRREHDDRQPR